MQNSLEHLQTLCVNRGTTNEQHNMSNTTTTDTLTFARTSEEIATRLNSWVQSQQPCWVIFTTQSGIWVRSFGRLSNTDVVYALNDDQNMSGVSFPLNAVESVGQSCIFLR